MAGSPRDRCGPRKAQACPDILPYVPAKLIFLREEISVEFLRKGVASPSSPCPVLPKRNLARRKQVIWRRRNKNWLQKYFSYL